jgi:outer membrane receptor protein involved in Fe transport
MKYRRRYIVGAAMWSAIAPLQVRAQAQPADTVQIIRIVAVTPQSGQDIDRNILPYEMQNARSNAVQRAQSENLTDFMARNLTGVNVNDISGGSFQSDVTFHGYRASPVLGASQGLSVYLDGVRVNEPFGDVVNWDLLPEAAIADIALAPGSNPLYGLNTLGGALALRTKSGATHPGWDANLSYGSGGQGKADVAYGAENDAGWHQFIAATLFDEHGWREHSDGHLGNLFIKLGHRQGATRWDVTLLGGDSHLAGNGLLPSYRWVDGGLQNGLYENQRRAAYTFPDQTNNRLRQASFNVTRRLDNNAELAVTAYARNSRRDTVNADISDAYADYVTGCAQGFGADGAARDSAACPLTRVEGAAVHSASLNSTSTRQNSGGFSANISTVLARHHLIAGVALDHSRISFAQSTQVADFAPDRSVLVDVGQVPTADASVTGASQSLALFAADTWQVAAATHLTASARWNHARVDNVLTNDDGTQKQEVFTYQKLNPAFGIAHDIVHDIGHDIVHDTGVSLTLFANLAQNNRVPTVIELGCADPAQPCRLPVGLQSDPFLKQVVARTLEAGVRGQVRGALWSASLYRTVNQDDILFRSAGLTQQGYFANVARTKHQGLDLNVNKQFGAVSTRIAYSYLDAIYDADGQLFTGARNVRVSHGVRIAGLPHHTLKLNLDWRAAPSLDLGADVVALSDLLTQGNEDGLRADPMEGQPPAYADWRIRGYVLLTLRASYRPDQHWEWFARINNAANRRYETYGAVALDLFPNGRLLRPQDGPVDAALARFVAPGAPRSVVAGLRYHF